MRIDRNRLAKEIAKAFRNAIVKPIPALVVLNTDGTSAAESTRGPGWIPVRPFGQAEKIDAKLMPGRQVIIRDNMWVSIQEKDDGELYIIDHDTQAFEQFVDGNPPVGVPRHDHTGGLQGPKIALDDATNGTLPVNRGGTGSNLSATGPGDLTQASSGAVFTVLKHNRAATTNPAVGDDNVDGYAVGSMWMNTTADTAYICTDAATGAAVWVNVGGSGGSGMTDFDIDGDDGDGPHTVTNGSTFTVTGLAGIGATMNGASVELNIRKDFTSPFASTDPDDHLMYFADSDSVLWTMQMKDLPYTPTTSGDWLSPPATIAAALDELAARIYAIENP